MFLNSSTINNDVTRIINDLFIVHKEFLKQTN